MATYGNPHTLPPTQCASNTPSWTDNSLYSDTTNIRKVHIDELRTEINNELSRRGISEASWSNPTITADSTQIRVVHINELRSAVNKIKTGNCSDAYYCPQDSSSALSWTDSTLTADSTSPRTVHISEIRSYLTELMQTCICEAEQCQYCADCGYHYTTCTHAGCHCDDHKYNECQYTLNQYWVCASVNLSSSTDHPYRSASGNPLVTAAWNDTVPWEMCNYAPPGSNWGSCEYQGGHDHTDWNCKCNPYAWS